MQVEGQGSRILGGSNRTREDQDGKEEGKGSIGMADT